MSIQFVKSAKEFQDYLKNNTYILLNFTASWCGPCQAIKAIVDQAYVENKNVEIVRIDLDSQRDLAEKYNITSVPSFVFVENGQEVDRITGANVQQLMARLQEFNTKAQGHKRKGKGLGAEDVISSNNDLKDIKSLIPKNFEILNSTIDYSGYEVLNCLPLYKDSKTRAVVDLKDSLDKSTVVSDSDSQLLFYIPFLNISKIYSVLIKVKSNKDHGTAGNLNLDSDDLEEVQQPNLVKIWCNSQAILSFDEASSDANAPHVEKVSDDNGDEWLNIKVKFVRFQNVQNITIFIDGDDEDYHTLIEKIVIVGVNGDSKEQGKINAGEEE
ncbi:Thioredoxin-like protein 1 [Candida viswanathii]|uniref:Thioredoxin-like protein 1 n=1 Tax=Candida viswanathii TaxID=5486 RepID=A0A367Y5W1_9ASCO|nr:Thioredoxin-like protein 1 [Candida viswanathii]